ncbi:MAG: ogt [Phycisphaerales bacterium]|nr:ogt [Phycisphaerales bacterium]
MAAVVLAYLPALWAGYVWDDDAHLPLSDLQRSLAGLWLVWTWPGATPQYYPLTHTSFWLEAQLWGLRPAGYHAVNVLLHAANGVLLWRVARRLGLPAAVALLTAAAFALHPVNVESVAWVSERKNVLSTLFYLAAGLCYLRSAGVGEPPAAPPPTSRTAPVPPQQLPPLQPASPDAGRRGHWYAAALGLFACAVLSKTVTSSLPAALCVLLWWHRRLDRRQVLRLLPMFAFAAGMAWVTAGMEKWNVGAVGRHWDWSFAERCLIAGRAVWFYAGKLAWPAGLAFVYPRWEIDAGVWWQYLFPAAAVGLVCGLWLARGRVGRGPLAAVMLAGGTLFPALGFVNLYPMRFSFVADHFVYLASPPLLALGAAAAVAVARRAATPPPLAAATGGIVLCVLAALTCWQTTRFHDEESLWRHTLAANPRAWLAEVNLGILLAGRGEDAAAAEHYARSLAIEPDQEHTHLAWAALLDRQGNVAAATAHYEAAGRIAPTDPRAPYWLGNLAARRGDATAAAARYRDALARDERHEPSRLALAASLAAENRPSDALVEYARALELNPYSLEARQRAAALLTRGGDPAAAVDLLVEGRRLVGPNAKLDNNLGVALLRAGRPAEAADRLREAVGRDPNLAEAWLSLGSALEMLGDRDGAGRAYERAASLNPSFDAARAGADRVRRQ